MYDLRLDRKLTKSMFAKWDKETKDWVVNAIASLEGNPCQGAGENSAEMV